MRPEKTFSLKDRDGDEHRYTVTLHPAEEATELLLQIVELVGEALDRGTMAERLIRATQAVVRAGGVTFVRKLLRYTRRDDHALSDAGTFNQSYAGNQAEMALALAEVVRENWGDFFDEGLITQLGLELSSLRPQSA